MFQRSLAAFILFSWVSGASHSQESPDLVTDRPDQTESASIVPEGAVQLEIGALATRVHENFSDTDVIEFPGTLVRVGLSESLELRVGWVGYVWVEEVSEGRFEGDGGGDAELGFKYRFFREAGRLPEMAVLVSTSVPVGDEDLTSDEVDPALRLAFGHTLSERLSLGYNVGIGWESGYDFDTSTLFSYVYTVALGVGLSERTGAFVELFGEIPGNAPGDPAHSFDGGFTFLLRDNVQFDVAGGVGLSDAAEDWFAGVGLSVRLPR